MMKPGEHWQRGDLPLCGALCMHRRPLPDPLVQSSVVVVADVLGHDAAEVPVVEHQDVVEALATERAEKALADRIHVRCTNRRTEDPDARGTGKRISAFLQVGVTAASTTKAIRSNRVTRGLPTERCSTVS